MNALAPTLRPPKVEDGADMWRLVCDTGVLDVNSPYLYVVMADHHADTCAVAHLDDRLAGFTIGYRVPSSGPGSTTSAPGSTASGVEASADAWFCWQVGVSEHARGHGLATKLILDVLKRQEGVRWIHTTVTPSNGPSRALFRGLARKLDTELTISEGYPSSIFPNSHEAEELLRIGPFTEEALHAAL